MDNWPQIALWGGQTVILLGLILGFLLKVLPTYKELKLKEFELKKQELEVREGESRVRGQEALALGQLAEVLNAVAVEQRRATETTEILQRVNADSADRLNNQIEVLSERIERLEQSLEHNDANR